MAKMFYTVDEVCEKLGKSEDEVREMASSGQIQEFRDRDKLMFKVDQIDLLAGDEDTDEVHLDLDDTSGGSGLGLTGTGTGVGADSGTGSGTGVSMTDSTEGTGTGTGISVFDTDHGGDEEDAGGETRVGDAVEEDLSLEAVGSGSGLLDLTRESDDTSLGAELLEEVYSGDENIEIPTNASGLFEAAGADTGGGIDEVVATAGIAQMPVMVEAYDGAGSGLGVGLMIGALAALICTALVVIVGLKGVTSELAMKFSENLYLWVGGLALIAIVCGLVGLFIGKSSE